MNKVEYICNGISEECAELTQASSKAIRFGFDGTDPITLSSNGTSLIREYLHIQAVIELLLEEIGVKSIPEDVKIKVIGDKKEKFIGFMNEHLAKGNDNH